MQIYPVIHYIDRATAIEQAEVARKAGADGVFLISHRGNDEEVVRAAAIAKRKCSSFSVGINLLSSSNELAVIAALDNGLDMVWADHMGISSTGCTTEARRLSDFARRHPKIQLFASVAFKYRPHEADPVLAAKNALDAGFIPTTSGAATGQAPTLDKIASMSVGVKGQLAMASGITPGNVSDYAPYLSYGLVATGIAINEHRIDSGKLRVLLENARYTTALLARMHRETRNDMHRRS